MSRESIRLLKKVVHHGTRLSASDAEARSARDAALKLLRHSVKLGHPRLAIMRLVDAVKLDAAIDDDLWDAVARLRSIEAEPAQRETLSALRASHRAEAELA